MNRDQKAAVVDEIAEQIKSAEAVFAVDYRGISVEQAADLRSRLRESGTRFRIVKNSLTERAADQAGAEALKALLDGPTALAFVTGDAALAAKALNDAARTLHTLAFKGGMMDSAALSAADVVAIARLPAREVLHAQLVGTIAAPITGLVRTLNALIAGLAIQLQQIADMDPPVLVSGEAPAAAAPEPEAPAAEPEAEAPAPEPVPEAPAAEPEAEAPAPESVAEAPLSDTIVDVNAEPGVPTPEETDQEAASDEESGA
ncbi:MAG TPA: 50S ribosomal protein L10 [Solirubrobacteraceae bacterium]|nr:50S ribosomal protein L10 [Solirubrobacteraceae bacterium]